MTDPTDNRAVKERLWKELDKAHFGMLGLMDVTPHQHFQPMTIFAEEDAGQIWFFTRDDTDLARSVAAGNGRGMLTVQSKDKEFQACLGGALTIDRDRVRIDRYWSPMVSAWYPDGKDDPHLTLLRFDLDSAAVWLGEAGPIKYALEIAKANATNQQPDIGGRAEVHFS